jgi:hypothetical protein
MTERTAADGVCEPAATGPWSAVTLTDEDWHVVGDALRFALHRSNEWNGLSEAQSVRLRRIIIAMRVGDY